MRLLYSNSLTPKGEQKEPIKSLGGYISGTSIPNDAIGNLFASISKISLTKKRFKENYLVVLENALSNDVENLSIWITYPEKIIDGVPTNVSKIKVELALVDPSVDSCGDFQFERLQSTDETPLYATFTEPNGIANAIDGETLVSGGYIGIWIRKTLNAENIAEESCDDVYARFEADEELEGEQEIVLSISYDEIII